MKNIFIVLLFTFAFSACEKDDICDANTPTTPRLVINFYDITNPTIPKNVVNLKVIGEGKTEGVLFSGGSSTTNATSISIPLKVDADNTTYSFILNDGNSNPNLISEDKVSFHYTRKISFVSRACGYKTNFVLDSIKPYTQTAVPITSTKWMTYISVEKRNIDNENETHIKVFF